MPHEDQAPNPPTDDDRVLRRLMVAWAVSLGLLVAATWPLWTPLRGAPRVALAWPLASLPPGLDFALLVALGGGLVGVLRRGGRRPALLATAALALLMAPDQLRWQPWAYHALLVGLLLSTGASARRLAPLLRWLAASVYVYSAAAKLDAEFAQTLGQQMLATLGSLVGLSVGEWPEGARRALALGLPAGELLIGLLLATAALGARRAARPGCLLAVAMHTGALLTLGPWGLGHSAGVLAWNALFAWQTVALFWPAEVGPNLQAAPAPRMADRLAVGLTLFALTAPLTSPWGGWDRWPSWGLYAPGGERAALFVHNAAVGRLPAEMQPFVEPLPSDGPWRRVRLDRWALEENLAPLYPQNRVTLALAEGLARRHALGDRVRVVAEGRAGRLDRRRRSVPLNGLSEIAPAARWFGFPPTVVWTE